LYFNFQVLTVEFATTKIGRKPIEDFMHSKGYVSILSKPEENQIGRWGLWDCIFVKRGSGYKEKRG
jgi:hypothetical protein